MPRSFDESIGERLRELERAGLLRVPDDGAVRAEVEAAATGLGVGPIDASSNDYLGLARSVSRETGVQGSALGHSTKPSAAWEDAHPGAGASRLVHGSRPEHYALERALADWVRLPAALLFTSGYAANLGLLTAVAGPGSFIVSDRLNHASLIDGCRLSRAPVEVVPHLAFDGVRRALEAAPAGHIRFVVTESYFSMDGDGPDLSGLRILCDDLGAYLIVDEAHALGVFGPGGAGRCRESGIAPDVLVGTLGKALGLQGAFVAGSAALRQLLWNSARSFVFSTATSPALAAAALFHVQRARSADAEREHLLATAERFRLELRTRGVEVLPGSFGPIVPVLIRDNRRALDVARQLVTRGILTQAIRPPTVPEGTARLRVTVTAAWPADGAARVAEAIAGALR
jgi:8-amino-7-oxononanoate synthase